LLEKLKSPENISKAYDNLGVLHGSENNWDTAFFYHNKSLALKKQQQDSVGIPFGYSHLANIYIKQKKFGLAKKYLDSAFTIRQKREDIYGLTDSHLYFGDLYFAKSEMEKAIFHFEKGYSLAV